MKKLLLLSLVMCFVAVGFSQEKPAVDKKYQLAKYESERINRATDDATNFDNPVSMARSTWAVAPSEVQIGTTQYDLFSNFNVGDRFWVFEDGTMAGVFMLGYEAATFPDRGTGYNYYDGTEWGPEPTLRIEDIKTGWPNITSWGTGGEIGVAHNGVAGLEIIKRATKGTGAWSQMNFLGPAGIEDNITWPRMVCSGDENQYTHMVVCTYGEWQGQATTIVYSRSDDGGETWDPSNVVLEEYGSEYYSEITQDKYVMASNGNIVCILYVDAYSDLFYVRSDDNGDNWERIVVWEHPVPFYASADPLDSCFVPDFSGHMAIDDNGHAHVVFGITRWINDENGSGFFTYNPQWNDGIGYWNDMMDPFSNDYNALAPPDIPYVTSELVEGETYAGHMKDLDGDGEITLAAGLNYPTRTYGMCTYPAIHIDGQGRRFIIYSANAEGYEYAGGTDPVNYKHIFARAYDGGGGWGEIVHLTADVSHIFDDCVYPMIGNHSDDQIYYIYQADITPGNALDGNHDYQENRWIAGACPKSDLLTGIEDDIVIEEGAVTQNFPNPFSTTSSFSVTLDNPSNLTLEISNLMGQRVYQEDLGRMPAGTHPVTIDATNLDAGVYFYTIKIGTNSVTRRMIVE